jgi:uncharacterized protein (TIGR02001 family)
MKIPKNKIEIFTLWSLIFTSVFLSSVQTAVAETSGNIGLSSDYLWRGISQSNSHAAISAGIDYKNNNSFYLGSWISSLDNGNYELDIYSGFAFEIYDIAYDIGVISYQYPKINDYFSEVYIKADFGLFNTAVAYTIDSKDKESAEFSSGDLYLSLAKNFKLAKELELNLLLGHYAFKHQNGDDYNNFNISISKDNFSFAIDKTTGLNQNNNYNFSVTWVKSL